MGTERVFSYKQKLSYLFLHDIRAVRLIDISLHQKGWLCYFYAHANFQSEVIFM